MHLVRIIFCRAWDKMGQKSQYMAQNDQKCILWAKFGRFWAKNPNSYGISVLQITYVLQITDLPKEGGRGL